PQANGSVHMYPGAGVSGAWANLRNRIEAAGIHVARLEAHDGVGAELGKLSGEHAALLVDIDQFQALLSESGHGQRFQHGTVHFRSDDDVNRRRAEHAVLFDIPASASE